MTSETAEALAKALYAHITCKADSNAAEKGNTAHGYYGDGSCLRHLNLSENRLGDSGVVAIAQALSSATSAVVAEQAAAAAAADQQPALQDDRYMGPTTLLLRNVEIHGVGTHAISTVVVSPLTTQLPPPQTDTLLSPLPAGPNLPDILRCCSVTELDLSENTIGDQGVSALLMSLRMRALMVGMGRMVGDRSTRLELRLNGCDMRPAECAELAEALRPFGGGTAVHVAALQSASGVRFCITFPFIFLLSLAVFRYLHSSCVASPQFW